MPGQRRQQQRPLNIGDRARSKLNRRVGTVDAIDRIGEHRLYGLHYDPAPQNPYLGMARRDGEQLLPDLIKRE
jgi:hypothetical protein